MDEIKRKALSRRYKIVKFLMGYIGFVILIYVFFGIYSIEVLKEIATPLGAIAAVLGGIIATWMGFESAGKKKNESPPKIPD